MKLSPDPDIHRQREQQVVQHVQKLLEDDRLRIDTTRGRRPVLGFMKLENRTDKAEETRRLMGEMKTPDRSLESRLPIGEMLTVTFSQPKLIFFRPPVAQLRVVCISPIKSLIAGQNPSPLATSELSKTLAALPAAPSGVPTTIVITSTSGFTLEAHELAERRADRTVILLEPNDGGGWTVTGPAETKALTDLFDPEAEDEKRQRVRDRIDESKAQLGDSGIASDKLAGETGLPVQLVEAELKAFARANPGLNAKRLDGRVVLFRDGSALAGAGKAESGGSAMPLIDKMKALFSRKGETEKKIAFLSERRAALSQQRDRAYEEMATFEKQEAALKRQFAEATGSITKRRVTSQLLQLRKELERRQQLITVVNQQVNVVSTHLHNLELVHQGQSAKLPDTDEITNDAVKAEEMLAQFEADSELASSVGQSGGASMSDEEQALFEELERESGSGASPSAANDEADESRIKTPPVRSPQSAPPIRSSQSSASSPRRNEPEAG